MAVKPATGEVIVEEKRTRLESASATGDEKRPELWDYVESLNDADWASQNYRFRIERGQPGWKSEDRTYVDQVQEKMTPAEISKRYGGGDYTIWFYGPPKGQQLYYKKLLKVDGPSRPVGTTSPGSYNGQPLSNDPLTRLIDVMDRRLAQMEAKLEAATGSGAATAAVQQAVGLTGKVFEAATTAATGTLSSIAGGTRSAETSLESTLNLLKTAKEIFGPPAGGPVSNSVKDFLEMLTAIKGAGLLGAPAGGSVTAQLAIEAIRVLPSAISEGVKGLEHWHLGEEARARQMAIQRGVVEMPAARATHSTAAPAAPPPVNPAAAAPPPKPQGAPPVEVNIETIEAGLVRILQNQSFTIEEAAHRAAALMEDLVPGMPDKVASAGEAAILNLFQTRPILMQVPQNPRLTEFIKKFIEVVKSAPVMSTAQPPNVPPA